jgi:Transcriptional repressor TCF25
VTNAERALFSLDCGLHPLFNVTLGTTRLPFEYFENRCFYLAVWYHMESLGRRGCWRTCLEFNKLLFAYLPAVIANCRMEPEENPYAALLAIDFPAMKAREYTYLIDLRDSLEWIDETGYLINIHYSAALAEYMLEKDQKKDHVKSSESLSRAIQRFPWLIAQLFFELKITFPGEFPTTVPPSPLQALYTDLYIHRSKELWAIPVISSWLSTVTKQVAPQIKPAPVSQTTSTIPLNVARHVFVTGVPALITHIPREYTARTQLASDPLPPAHSVSPYDAPIRSLPGIARDATVANRWIGDLVMNMRAGNLDEGEVDDEDDVDALDDNGRTLGPDAVVEGEARETLVAQLTNTFRNVFGWFGTQEGPQDDEPQDDGQGVD